MPPTLLSVELLLSDVSIYPLNVAGKGLGPESEEELPSLSSACNGEAVPVTTVTSRQEDSDPNMTALSMECFAPSAINLTPTIENQSIDNKDGIEVATLQSVLGSGSSNDQNDLSTTLMGSSDFDRSLWSDSYSWTLLGAPHELGDTVDCSEYLHDFDSPDADHGSPSTQELSGLLAGSEDREDAFETFSKSLSAPTDSQSPLTSGGASLNSGASTAGTTAAIDEEQSTACDIPSQNGASLLSQDSEAVATSKPKSTASRRQTTKQRKAVFRGVMGGSASSLFIAHERGKLADRHLRCSEDYFTTVKGRNRIVQLDLEDYAEMLHTMNFALGSCEAIVVLGNMLRAYRESNQTESAVAVRELSLTRRLDLIRRFGGTAAYYTLFRNLHVLYFTREATSRSASMSGNFVEFNPDSREPRSKRQRGNPRNCAEAAITKKTMKLLYPDLGESNTDYDRLYSEIKRLRKYGQRLDKLVEAFGLGIMGLIPLIRNVSTADQAFEITHQA